MTPAALPPGLTSRPLRQDEAPAVVELMAEAQRVDEGEVMVDLEDIEGDWQRPSMQLDRDTLGIFDGERLVAYGDVYQGRRAEVFVRPDARGRGLGAVLMRWTWQVAATVGSPLVGQTVPADLDAAVSLFTGHGYEQRWTSWILELPSGAAIEAGPPTPGVRLRPFVAGQDEMAAYRVIEDAFNEWPDRDPSTYEDWAAGTLGRSGFEPWQLLLAERTADGAVVGACYLIMSGSVGWVHQIAVQRAARGQGIARALLLRAFSEARERGAQRCELSTDSRTGALGLYEHVGMRISRTYVHYAKTLPG